MAINRSKNRIDVVQPDKFTLQAGASLEAVIQIAEEREGYLLKMKDALVSEDDVQLKLYARKLCGLPSEPQQTQKPTIKRKRT